MAGGADEGDDYLSGLGDQIPEEENAAEWADWATMKRQMEQQKVEQNVHDEL